ncbi:MAG: LysR family transcriptional regulator [Rhodobacteraceae bacterium]|nr:LysR family transcriptional regulator [Paracoccaceae bacterium]TVR45867.1 MAG: LysR family transcriptional regulator [Paracoccaceae bacterium]
MDWRDLPPLSALRAFAAWAESGSVVTAAARLGVTHAAISQQIRALEKALDIGLVSRNGRRIEMTDEGRRLAEGLTRGFGEIAHVVAELRDAQDLRPLQVTTTPMFASAWLVPRLGAFRAAHPAVDLVIDPVPGMRMLEPGGIDVAIRSGSGGWPGLESRLLVPAPLIVVGAPELLKGVAEGDLDALTALPWLSELGHNEATQFLARQGVAQGLRGGVTHLPGNLMLDAVRAGHGLAVVTEALAASDIASGRLRIMLRDDSVRGYFLVTRPGIQRPPLRAFVRWITREAARKADMSVAAFRT